MRFPLSTVELPPQTIIDFYQAVDPAALLTQVMGWESWALTPQFLRVPCNVGTFDDALEIAKALGFNPADPLKRHLAAHLLCRDTTASF